MKPVLGVQKLYRGNDDLLIRFFLSAIGRIFAIALIFGPLSAKAAGVEIHMNGVPISSSSISNTCVSYLSASPHNISSLFLLGDSITNASKFKNRVQSGLAARGMDYAGSVTVSGIGIGQALEMIQTPGTSTKISNADILFTELGVNNWGQANNNPESIAGLVDSLISRIKEINSDIIILWQEPYAHMPSLKNEKVARGAAFVADYLREKDASGEICLIPWRDLVEIDDSAYTDVRHPDGVHIWGNEQIYLGVAFGYIDALFAKP